MLVDTEVTIGVQINGKMRGEITLSPEATEAQALEMVRKNEQLVEKINDQNPKKVIYVPGRILNLIV
jgi:leucyl-tRNA synthetase